MSKEPKSDYRSKLGPIPPEAFENDALSNDPSDVDTSAGSSYDKLKRRLDEQRNKPKK